MTEEKKFFTKHLDTIIIIGSVLACFLLMNSSVTALGREIANLQQEITVIKTILIMKNIVPQKVDQKIE